MSLVDPFEQAVQSTIIGPLKAKVTAQLQTLTCPQCSKPMSEHDEAAVAACANGLYATKVLEPIRKELGLAP